MRASAAAALVMSVALPSEGRLREDYVQQQTDAGWLFHVFSRKLPAAPGHRGAAARVDYTYLERPDSVTVLATLRLESALTPQEAEAVWCGGSCTVALEQLYVQPAGKGYDYRLRARLPFGVWAGMYACDTPFTLTFRFAGAQGEVSRVYGYSPKSWTGERRRMEGILQMVRQNTGKPLWGVD